MLLWAVACQVPLSMGFSRQEFWSGLPFSSPGDLPDPRIELASPALAGGFFNTEPLQVLAENKAKWQSLPWAQAMDKGYLGSLG